ncbi:putative N-acetylglucosaminyl transferase [Paraburkholderia piptadeniae]|uniref:N-acetylglucosaminyl transferase n=1 Tax=Paraburkholderia piptadeniae TaxID=1701573 RepID=A0A1N7SRX0_9BURK|nr:putative N-acetylglucosaminyl transferase [Paraburkholderia piptadeniae]
MNLGLFVLFLLAPILGYGAYMSSRGRKHDRQRRHRRIAR